MFKMPQSNLQYVTSISFLLTTYAKYMKATEHNFNCGNMVVNPGLLINLAKRQASSFLSFFCTILFHWSGINLILYGIFRWTIY